MYVALESGQVTMAREHCEKKRYPLNEDGAVWFMEDVRSAYRDGEYDIMKSSSLDFPQDHGAPEGWDFNTWREGK